MRNIPLDIKEEEGEGEREIIVISTSPNSVCICLGPVLLEWVCLVDEEVVLGQTEEFVPQC